jgi:hypothetical protein
MGEPLTLWYFGQYSVSFVDGLGFSNVVAENFEADRRQAPYGGAFTGVHFVNLEPIVTTHEGIISRKHNLGRDGCLPTQHNLKVKLWG